MTERRTLAILVGGGPAPGINSVIGAATIRARLEAVDVLGVRDGFEWIMQGDIDHVTPLDIGEVSRIHFRGGSYIGISRANPTKDPAHLDVGAAAKEIGRAHVNSSHLVISYAVFCLKKKK